MRGRVDAPIPPLQLLVMPQAADSRTLYVGSGIGPRLSAWAGRIEALPFFIATYPPHWKAAA
jgi:hypothetical protein